LEAIFERKLASVSLVLYNRLDNQLHRVNKHPTGWTTGCIV